ncbi:MAG: hypothetical protein JNM18_18950, partial [Planctomycetaceae bacterium]|nr:hypothetical protein [Planctomycetaceae bacterium]
AIAPLRGLTAEQLRWSFLQATGRVALHHAKLDAAAKSKPPAKQSPADNKSAEPDPAWKVKHQRHDALERQTVALIAAFAGLPGQSEAEFQPVVDQALFLKNSTKLLPLLQDEPGTTLARLATIADVEPLADELYLSGFSRRPTPDEFSAVQQLLSSTKSPAERREALQSLLWGLLLSAEFRLNH